MNAQDIYNRAETNGVQYETNCTAVKLWQWENLMQGATKADKNKVKSIIHQNCPEFENLLIGWNPYDHYKTKTHIIFVHSAIEYFFKIN